MRVKITCAALMLGASLVLANPAAAGQIQVGYSTSLYGPYQAGSGGEFTLNDVNGPNWLDLSSYVVGKTSNFGEITSFQTFCIEESENISGYPTTYNAQINAVALYGSVGPEGDPISVGTGWLYSQFASGNLDNYAYFGSVSDRKASATLLQQAFWWLEGEGESYSANNIFMLAVYNKFGGETEAKANGGAAYGVSAVNLWQGPDLTKNRGQDQLYYKAVPDGGMTLMLLGMTLGGLAALPRRFRKD